MTYAGNPSISSEVRQRILGTFEQTLQLAGEGSRQEALLGCDFVLRMDPHFEPARLLQERLKTSLGPVRVDDLQGGGKPQPDDPFGDLDGLDGLGLPDLPDFPAPLAGGGAGLRAELRSLFDQHRLQELMATAQREQAAVMADPELQRIVAEAQERMEAEPYVLKFLTAARQALQAGQAVEAARSLDKARALDPDHPGIAELDAAVRTAQAAPPPRPPEPVQFPAALQTPVMPPSFDLGPMGGIGDSESQRRIRELLDEGQTALNSGDPQGAIDTWSRIFLLDIDNQEAARRIEAARRLKAENERQVEEVFHEGVSHLEAGDSAAARRAFERVLQLQPGHFTAREYLQQIDAGTVSAPRPAGLRDVPVIPPQPPLPLPSDLDLGDSLREEILVPPDPSEIPGGKAAVKTPTRAAAAASRGGRAGGEGRARRLFFVVGGAVLLLALAGGWLLLQNRDQLFPNSTPEAEAGASAQPAQSPIERATRLQKSGKTPLAVAVLKRVPPNDPQYAEAQRLIAEWEGKTAVPEPAATTAPAVEGAAGAPTAVPVPTSQSSQRREELLAAARQAYGERGYLRALTRLEQAAALGKLDGEDARLLEDTKRKLVPIAQEIDLFRQGEWEFVIPRLWRLHEENPADRDVTQLLADSYYNLGVRDLQRADASKAAENFQESLNLQPNDPVLRRHLQFAQTYEERPKDLLYRIYVKYLPFR